MGAPRLLLVVLLWTTAARASELQPLIDRPITLPAGKLDLTLHGTYARSCSGFAFTAERRTQASAAR